MDGGRLVVDGRRSKKCFVLLNHPLGALLLVYVLQEEIGEGDWSVVKLLVELLAPVIRS